MCRFDTFEEILLDLKNRTSPDARKNVINVTRGGVWEGARNGFCRGSFNPCSLLSVRFSGEDGIDSGGLTREFLRLLFRELCDNNTLFFGKTTEKCIAYDYKCDYSILHYSV